MLRRKSKDKTKVKTKAKAKAKPKKPKREPKTAMEGVALQKPSSDVYTMMLFLSLAAIIVSCVLLYLELSTYGSFPQWNVSY